MPNPLLLLATTRPWVRKRGRNLRRVPTPIPNQLPSTDAIFLVLRRMRGPLILIVLVFSVAVAGLSLIPGVDAEGNPARLSLFDSFYVMSYTATTIGFGEVPYAFTIPQRMWMTASIFASVTAWAYSIGSMFALLQDPAFREASATQRFRRRVRRFAEPFLIVAGYGGAGRAVAKVLDEADRRFVVVDHQHTKLDRLAGAELGHDAPGLEADVRIPAVLGLAGLDHPYCAGVLALTDDDNANLAVVMSGHLLRPDVPIVARCSNRTVEERMHHFAADAVINPQDRYGAYLLLAIRQPETFRLAQWLMSPVGTEITPQRKEVPDGRWIVVATGEFGEELKHDLEIAGLDVELIGPDHGDPVTTGAVGMVAGTPDDAVNLALAAHARHEHPELFLAVRQSHTSNAPLVDAFGFDSVYVPTSLVAQETLARVVTPLSWRFIEYALGQSDEWAAARLTEIVRECGTRTPEKERIDLSAVGAPAVHRWLRQGHPLTIAQLISDPDDRDRPLRMYVAALVRGEEFVFDPDVETLLEPGDSLLVLTRRSALRALGATLFYDSTVEYSATGRTVPQTWLFRVLRRTSGSRDGSAR